MTDPINEDPEWIDAYVAGLPGADAHTDEERRLVVEQLSLLAMGLNAALDDWEALPHDVWDA